MAKQPPKRQLAERAVRFAKEYVELVEALKREGVPEEIARNEARIAATSWLVEEIEPYYDPAAGPCPTCGRG